MVQVGTTKDQGLYNKLPAAVHPGALAAGTLPQYNTKVTLSAIQNYGTRWRRWLRHCSRSRKVAGSIPKWYLGFIINLNILWHVT